uniref:Uncharacterized protein n=1 Tax=Daphnia galeata TaxID=27404 RepID=A0A8J2RNC8_9CRUS|nr:unnamed protein product [Daphnia galeata]
MAGIDGQKAPKTSGLLMLGSILSFIKLMLLVMSFASPHWLVSWQDTYSPFKNMGLWEFCFSRFRYPNYQFDDLFDGCHYVFSKTYFVIWEWLLPGWLMAVQAFMTLALIFCCSAHIASTMLLVRWPLNFTFRHQWQILSVCTLMNGLTTLCLFLSVAVFGGQCWRRDWMLYPNFNYLSWSYAFAVIAMFVGMAATACFYFDAKRTVERKRASSNLVVQMQSHGSQIYI